MEELLKQILFKLDNVATKEDVAAIHYKLDAIMEQVAKNTEVDTAFSEVAAAVQDHTTDIKLIKKIISS